MSEGKSPKRRNVFIKKGFQANFSRNFLILIVIESLMGIGIFSYVSKGTLITGYSGSELVVSRTGEYFLPALLVGSLLVVGVTAILGFVFILMASHKIAGPLYRFERSLEKTGMGDLTYRFDLRSSDQLTTLADRVNEFNSRMEGVVSRVQRNAEELNGLLREIQSIASSGSMDAAKLNALVGEAALKLDGLKKDANYFNTSYNLKKEGV
ncbi:MAG: methyl-accepting chemotaxis protein [Deltaproteobacteria bacterium]|nr:methyl-accepting chemotaxis protein [Deltaproteobacteria bacterium]